MANVSKFENEFKQKNFMNNFTVGAVCRKPYVEILEQPTSKGIKFRYPCEGQRGGRILGVSNKSENRTYPTIRIVGYHGLAAIVVSCVTKDPPYRAHPHQLVGKDYCKDGIYRMEINTENMTVTFSNLGIQCVKKKDIVAALEIREKRKIDPFRQGFDHGKSGNGIDLNVVRLCFQAFILDPLSKQKISLDPVVSDPIYDKKAMFNLFINRLNPVSSSVRGGQDVILLCEKVAKEDIKVRFFEEIDGQRVWEEFAEFNPDDVHKQVAIAFKTPPYGRTTTEGKVNVFVELFRPSDGETSEPKLFFFTPDYSEYSHPERNFPPDYWQILNPQPVPNDALVSGIRQEFITSFDSSVTRSFPVEEQPDIQSNLPLTYSIPNYSLPSNSMNYQDNNTQQLPSIVEENPSDHINETLSGQNQPNWSDCSSSIDFLSECIINISSQLPDFPTSENVHSLEMRIDTDELFSMDADISLSENMRNSMNISS